MFVCGEKIDNVAFDCEFDDTATDDVLDNVLLDDHTEAGKAGIPVPLFVVAFDTAGLMVPLDICLSSVKDMVVTDALLFWSVN